MQKLTQAILDAQAKLKISQSELSRRLGKGRNYLGNIQDGCSTAKQLEIIDMINRVVVGEVFKSDGEIIAELSEKLEEARDKNAELIVGNLSLKKESDSYFNQIQKLEKKHVDDMNKLLDKVADLNESLTKAKSNWGSWQRKHNQTQILLNQSEENTLYWMAKVPTTRWGAFKLFVKLMFGGKA